MIFGTFSDRSISSWKARRDELAVHVQDAEHTGEGVHLATSAIADQLVRCECAVKKLEANLDKLRKVAQGLVVNQPSIPLHCSLSARQKKPVAWESSDMDGEGGVKSQVAGDGGEMEDLTSADPVTLGYAIADLAARDEIEERQKNRLRSIIESRTEISLADVCLVWITVLCVLGTPSRAGTCAVARVYFDLVRNKRQSTAILTSIFGNLSKASSLGLLKLQQEAKTTFGLIQDSKYPNSWLAITLIDELSRRYIFKKLTSASQRFKEESWQPSDDNLQEFCSNWIEETEREFTEQTLLHPNRQDLIELLLQFLAKIKISALSLYRCALKCSNEDHLVTPMLLSTCSDSMIDTIEAKTQNCHSVTELYSIFLRVFCAAAAECDDRRWLVLVAAGVAMFYSRLISICLPARLNLAIYAAGFVSVALESLPKEAREHVESSRQVADALMSLSQAQPGGFKDTSEEVASKLLNMCGVSSWILRKSATDEADENILSVTEKKSDEGVDKRMMMKYGVVTTRQQQQLSRMGLESSPLPEIILNRSILDLAQGEAPAATTTVASYDNDAMAASSPVLTTRFSFDNLLGGAGGSRETSVAAFVGKWATWGRRS